MFESVLLPAPFSPSRACTSPTSASKSTWSFATTPGKALGDAAHRHGRLPQRGSGVRMDGSVELMAAAGTRSAGAGRAGAHRHAVDQPFGLPSTPLTSQSIERISPRVIFFPFGTRSLPAWS